MIANKALHRIQTGDATPREARQAVLAVIANLTPETSASLYAALRSWTWKALLTRRFDSEMEEWFRVLRTTASTLARRSDVTGHYVEALSHLVDESLRYAAFNSRGELMSRSHIGELLSIVRRNNGRVERSVIEHEAGLRSSRLSQLLTELTVAGALSRELDNKRATFTLTDEGRELLDTWTAAPRPAASGEPPIDTKYAAHVARHEDQPPVSPGNAFEDRLEIVELGRSTALLIWDGVIPDKGVYSNATVVTPANDVLQDGNKAPFKPRVSSHLEAEYA